MKKDEKIKLICSNAARLLQASGKSIPSITISDIDQSIFLAVAMLKKVEYVASDLPEDHPKDKLD